MNIKELNSELDDLLKDFIESEGHIDTGALYRSVKFKCKFSKNQLDISFTSEDYIKFLQDGTFINQFFELNSVLGVIQEFYVDNLDIDLS